MSPERVRRLADQRKHAIDELVRRYETAYRQSQPPGRRGDDLGVRVTGTLNDITYSDPTGQSAALLLDTLDRIVVEMTARRDADWRLANVLEEFGQPVRHADVKRCGEQDCATKLYAKGLCEKHYKRKQRQGGNNDSV